MSDDRKKPSLPFMNLYEWLFRASLLLFGSVIVLNLAIVFLVPILPWIVGVLALAAIVWLVIVIVRWRRSRW
jgi:hypothetical protein